MATLILRGTKGQRLTHEELDSNFLALDSDISILQANYVTTDTAQTITGAKTLSATLTAQNIIPSADSAYDLGSAGAKWKDLYLSGQSIYLGSVILKDSAGSLVIYDSVGIAKSPFTATTADAWTTGRTITLTGDVTGTSGSFDGSGNLSFATTIAANSVALGTDTTGNYVGTIAGTTNQVNVSGSGSETAAVTLSLPQDIHTGASPTFSNLSLNGLLYGSLTDSITAGSTQTQAGATSLTTMVNRVTTVTTDGDGVKLPTATAGARVIIINDDSAQLLRIWPNTSDTIEGGTVDAADLTDLPAGEAREYVAVSATDWQSIPLGGAGSSTFSINTYTMSGGETSQIVSYTPGQLNVYLNGTLLKNGTDYIATNGTSITGLSAMSAGSILEVHTWATTELYDSSVFSIQTFTMSGGETSQAVSYTPGKLNVYLNGALLLNGTDYIATNGTSITGLQAMTSGDILEIHTWKIVSVYSVASLNEITDVTITSAATNDYIKWNGSAWVNSSTFTDSLGELRQLPTPDAEKTGSYSLDTGDVGVAVLVGSGGSVTIPDSVFSADDIVSVVNKSGGNITITCSITTCDLDGVDVATITVADDGMAVIFFQSGTACTVFGRGLS